MTARVVRLLELRGRDPRSICLRAGVSLEEATAVSARIPYRLADALFEHSAAELGAPGLALALLGIHDEQTYDAAGLVLMSSPTFGDGLARALAYQRLWADGERFTFVRDAEGATLRFRHPGKSALARAVCAELAFLETVSAARVLVAPNVAPSAIRFAHERLGPDEDLARALGVRPTYGAAHNELTFDEQVVAAPIKPPEGALAMLHGALAKRALAALPAQATLSARLKALLAENPRLFSEPLSAVAVRLNVSPRTAQRRLEQEGTSWTDVVDGARRQRVRELDQQAVAEKEIAYLVGFTDLSALRRARTRWRRGGRRG